MHVQLRITAAFLTVFGLGSTEPVWAQDTGVKPVLDIAARPTTLDGSRGRDAGVEQVMEPGRTATSYLLAGRLSDPEGSLCPLRGIAMTPIHDLAAKALAQAQYVWKIVTTTVKHEGGRQTFDLEWERRDGGAASPAVTGKQRLTLTDGESYTLDFVRGSGAAPCRTPGVAIVVSAGVREDPSFADTVLGYDLWLVRHDASGRKETKHLVLSGLHGAAVDFQFAPLLSPLEKRQPDQYDFKVATRVAGTLRGRMTRDGRISVELETRRSDRLERPGGLVAAALRGGSGRKVLTATLGEVIEIQLPPASGNASTYASQRDEQAAAEQRARGAVAQGNRTPTPLSTEAAAIRDGRLEVNFGRLLEGERLSLILQVKRVGEGAEQAPPRSVSRFLRGCNKLGAAPHVGASALCADADCLRSPIGVRLLGFDPEQVVRGGLQQHTVEGDVRRGAVHAHDGSSCRAGGPFDAVRGQIGIAKIGRAQPAPG